MRLQPIIYNTDMPATVAWYTTVLGSEPTYTSDVWSSFEVAGATSACTGSRRCPTEAESRFRWYHRRTTGCIGSGHRRRYRAAAGHRR